MVKSMYAAVAGLRTHQSKMDVIGNNIANVNTYGYKKERSSFADTYYATSRAAAEATNVKGGVNPSQVGYGVKMAGVSNIITTGGASITDNPTDCMISGNGYFLVGSYNMEGYTNSSKAVGVGDERPLTSLNFTRVGIFSFDGQGNFVDGNGSYVYGYSSARGLQALKDRNADGTVKSNPVTFTIPADPVTGAAAQTYTVVPHNGIDGTQVSWYIYKGAAPAAPTGKEDNFAFSLKVDEYDPAKTENLFVFDEKSDYKDPKIYTLDEKTGYIKNIATGVVQSTSDKLRAIQIPRTYTMDGFYDEKGNPLEVTLFSETDSVQVNAFVPKRDAGGNIERDPITNKIVYQSSVQTIDGKTYWNVATAMKLSSVSVGSDGTVTGINGDTNQVITVGKISVADVPNPMALEALGDNYLKAKANTGLIEARNPGEGSTGSLASGTLEMSNVDLANEFTEMITTQRGYQANSRIITVTDSMLEELVNLKRG